MPLPQLDRNTYQGGYPESYFECFEYFTDRFLAICLWQELYPEEVPDFAESWLQNHLESLENWMSNLKVSQYVYSTVLLISLCFHEKIRKKACEWTKNLKNHINQDLK